MKMYLTATGQYARTKDEAGKGHTAVEVPTDARGLVAYLNAHTRHKDVTPVEAPESPVQHEPDADGPQIAPEFVEKLYAPPANDHDSYQSPMSARTQIAGIDAGMVSAAVRQFNGTNLAKVMTAGIERMAELARGVA